MSSESHWVNKDIGEDLDPSIKLVIGAVDIANKLQVVAFLVGDKSSVVHRVIWVVKHGF